MKKRMKRKAIIPCIFFFLHLSPQMVINLHLKTYSFLLKAIRLLTGIRHHYYINYKITSFIVPTYLTLEKTLKNNRRTTRLIFQIHLRGMLGSLMQFFLCVGFLISYIVGPFVSYLTLIIVSGVVPFLCILTFIWVPESPHFLLNKDRKQEALEALYWFRGYPEKILMQMEITDILV